MSRCFVLSPDLRGISSREPEQRLEEAVGLTRAIDLDVVATESIALDKRHPATFFGSGKVEEIGARVSDADADLVIINSALSPVQQRNLEREWKAKVLDRTGLILEIFGRRAQTREGVMQVDLAHLSFQKSRLVRSWTHLERQRGGAGFMGGPGERQIESDRRMIDEKITRLRRQLNKVVQTRTLHRKARKKAPFPVVVLVGYTNAGKSTLFNNLTQANVKAEDMLFATLDPTMREIRLPSGRTAILSDTVGFISDLPTELVAAFRATLEEVLEADLILHVRDISSPTSDAEARDVDEVLGKLGVHDDAARFEVLNKIDLLSEPLTALETKTQESADRLQVSAKDGSGCPALLTAIENAIYPDSSEVTLSLMYSDGAALAWLYERGLVLDRKDCSDRIEISAELTVKEHAQFRKNFKGSSHLW